MRRCGSACARWEPGRRRAVKRRQRVMHVVQRREGEGARGGSLLVPG
jgi:hypothetical protein